MYSLHRLRHNEGGCTHVSSIRKRSTVAKAYANDARTHKRRALNGFCVTFVARISINPPEHTCITRKYVCTHSSVHAFPRFKLDLYDPVLPYITLIHEIKMYKHPCKKKNYKKIQKIEKREKEKYIYARVCMYTYTKYRVKIYYYLAIIYRVPFSIRCIVINVARNPGNSRGTRITNKNHRLSFSESFRSRSSFCIRKPAKFSRNTHGASVIHKIRKFSTFSCISYFRKLKLSKTYRAAEH